MTHSNSGVTDSAGSFLASRTSVMSTVSQKTTMGAWPMASVRGPSGRLTEAIDYAGMPC